MGLFQHKTLKISMSSLGLFQSYLRSHETYLNSCSSSNSSPFYALSSISFYDTKPKIVFMWVKLRACLKSSLISLGDLKRKSGCGMEREWMNESSQLWSVTYSMVLVFCGMQWKLESSDLERKTCHLSARCRSCIITFEH